MSIDLYQGAAADLRQAQVDIGVLEAKVEHLTKLVDELKSSNRELQEKVDAVLRALSEARGGWRMLMLLGGAGAAAATGIAWIVDHLPRWVR